MNAVCHKLKPAGKTESFSLLKGFKRVKLGEGIAIDAGKIPTA
jgi:hypothetical protein